MAKAIKTPPLVKALFCGFSKSIIDECQICFSMHILMMNHQQKKVKNEPVDGSADRRGGGDGWREPHQVLEVERRPKVWGENIRAEVGKRVDGGGKSGLWDTVNLGGGSRRLILEMSLYISAGRLLHSLRCPLGLGIHRDSRVVFRVEHRVLQRVNYKKKKKIGKPQKKFSF